MKKQNSEYFVGCQSCQRQNELFRLNCSECGSVLDNRFPNLDLWTTIAGIIENPAVAFKWIIRAENKNFVFLLLLLLAVRFASYGEFFAVFVLKNNVPAIHSLFSIVIYLLALLPLYFILKKMHRKTGAEVRFTDVLACSAYAALPLLFAGIFLFLLEYIFFGKYLFSIYPNAFMINDIVAWMFIGMEFLLFVHYLYLLFVFIKIYSNHKAFSVLLSLFTALIFVSLYFVTLGIYGN